MHKFYWNRSSFSPLLLYFHSFLLRFQYYLKQVLRVLGVIEFLCVWVYSFFYCFVLYKKRPISSAAYIQTVEFMTIWLRFLWFYYYYVHLYVCISLVLCVMCGTVCVLKPFMQIKQSNFPEENGHKTKKNIVFSFFRSILYGCTHSYTVFYLRTKKGTLT